MTSPYGLTREMADAIVKAVAADAQCRLLLSRFSAFHFFSPVGQAGTARNLFNAGSMGFADIDNAVFKLFGHAQAGRETREYWQDVGDREACTGVAATTSRALSKAAGQPGYEFLKGAGAQDRVPSDPPHDFHTATAVTVTGDHIYVFDWHATLDIENPLVYRSPWAFRTAHGAVKYHHFWGWS